MKTSTVPKSVWTALPDSHHPNMQRVEISPEKMQELLVKGFPPSGSEEQGRLRAMIDPFKKGVLKFPGYGFSV